MVRSLWLPVVATVFVATLVSLPLTGPSSSASAQQSALLTTEDSTTTTWSLQPSSAEGTDGRVSLRHTIEGGSEVSDSVAVTNFGDRAAVFAVYASDGIVTEDGNFDIMPGDVTPVDGGAWVSVGPVEGSTPRDGGGMTLEVPAGATMVIPTTIRVPENATPGDHPAGIVAQLVPDDQASVQLASRVGVRIHLRVAGEIAASLTPAVTNATYIPSWNPFAPGTVEVDYVVTNDGNVRLGANGVISVTGPFGVEAGDVSTETREVLPGESVQASTQFWASPVVFGWGVVAVEPLVVGEDDVPTTLTVFAGDFTVWLMPWSQIIFVLLLVAAVLAIIALKKRSAERIQARIDAAVAAAAVATAAAATPAIEAAPELAEASTSARE